MAILVCVDMATNMVNIGVLGWLKVIFVPKPTSAEVEVALRFGWGFDKKKILFRGLTIWDGNFPNFPSYVIFTCFCYPWPLAKYQHQMFAVVVLRPKYIYPPSIPAVRNDGWGKSMKCIKIPEQGFGPAEW